MLILFAAFVTLSINSCNDAPGPIGSELVPNSNLQLFTISNDTLPLIVSTAIGQITPKMATELAFTSSNSPFFVGAARTPDGDRFTATAYLRYQLPVVSDSIRGADYAGLTANDIIDVRLFLRPGACLLGDTINKVSPFSVYEIRQRWYNDSITRVRTVPTAQMLTSQPRLANYSQQLSGGQINASGILSRKRPLTLNDKAMFANWILADSAKWANNIFGLALVPSDDASALFRFDESSYIVVRFKRPQDSVERILTITEDAQATIGSSPLPSNPASTEIMVQGGIAHRTSLLFDLSASIPELATIHQAELILPVDSVRSLVSTCGFPRSVQLSFAPSDNRFGIDTTARINAFGELNTTTGTIRYIFASGTNTSPNMVGIIQRLVKLEGRKGQLSLHFVPQAVSQSQVFRGEEEQTFNRIVFRRLRGSANPALRPRLTITYSLRPR